MRKSIFSFTQENEWKKNKLWLAETFQLNKFVGNKKDKKIAKCAHKFQNSCIILFTSNISRGKENNENKNKNNNMNWENAMNKQTHYAILRKNESNAACRSSIALFSCLSMLIHLAAAIMSRMLEAVVKFFN